MFRLTTRTRSLSRTRAVQTKKITTLLSRPRYLRQFSDNAQNEYNNGTNIFSLFAGGVLGGGVVYMYMRSKQFESNTDAVVQAKANYEALKKF